MYHVCGLITKLKMKQITSEMNGHMLRLKPLSTQPSRIVYISESNCLQYIVMFFLQDFKIDTIIIYEKHIELLLNVFTMEFKISFLSYLLTTTVIGPMMLVSFSLVKFLTRQLSNMDLPTFGGPTMATSDGGGSADCLSTRGVKWRRSLRSMALEMVR